MKLEDKIEALDKAVDNTLFITHYKDWELSSYGEHSLFSLVYPLGHSVKAQSFTGLINKAYKKLVRYKKGKEKINHESKT